MLEIKRIFKRNLPNVVNTVKDIRGKLRSEYIRLVDNRKEHFNCPICGYSGPFVDYMNSNYSIQNTQCPKCELFERHRLQYLVIKKLEINYNFANMKMLHFAPEVAFSRYFRSHFALYHTVDIDEEGVDYHADICKLPFGNAQYDVIYASHVLEHVKTDALALTEIKRVLKPNGFAILSVPVVSPYTIEYSCSNPYEFGHVRAIGLDYFNLYRKYFSRVEVWDSSNFDQNYQLYTYEDRSIYPNERSPQRVPMCGYKHKDYVPVCYV